MTLFSSKLDPLSSFTINVGPLYVERVFDSLLSKQGVKDVYKMNPRERFAGYLEYLKKPTAGNNQTKYAFIQFYKGYFNHQLANNSSVKDEIQHFQEKALCYYQTYLETSASRDESNYYAQWQIGILQDGLNYPWLLTQDALLKASAVDALRGETIRKITHHFIRLRQWQQAHVYSSIAMKQFLGKNPVALRRWFVDFDAYNWMVARTHRLICYKLGRSINKFTAHGSITNQTISEPKSF